MGDPKGSCNWQTTPGNVRDQDGVGMLECSTCELKKHEFDLRHKVNYESGTMHIWTGGYGEELVGPSLDKSRRINFLKELIIFDPKKSILDFGCVNGEMLEILKTEFANVMGLEPDVGAKDLAISRGFNVVGAINELKVVNLKFDFITLFHVIEHIYDPIDLLIEIAGAERFQLVHANDSMDVCGALKDRHQNIGEGHIGLAAFQEMLDHPVMKNVPMVLETPGMEPEHGKEIAMLKKMRG
jgi:SAM-dependent methyltransferase